MLDDRPIRIEGQRDLIPQASICPTEPNRRFATLILEQDTIPKPDGLGPLV